MSLLQLICVLYMRDSLLLAILTVLVHSEKLRQWQCAKIPKAQSKYFFSRLCGAWWTYNTKAC